MEQKRSSFSSNLGFVLAAAGSAVGLGNIWRFPYLAAEGGGGVFLLVYVIMAFTFGFTLLFTEISLGRKTKQSCLTAYGKVSRPFGWLGGLASVIPFLILPYYCTIGGWVLKYAVSFVIGQGTDAAGDSYFTDFITSPVEPMIYNAIFLILTCAVVFIGVNKGIELLSKILMPALLVIVVGISIYCMTLQGGETYEGRTGIDGFLFYIVPNFSGMTFQGFLDVCVSAMGQLFYSISVAMGIMVTYGSYFKDKSNLIKSVNQIEIFDTIIAFLAGVMIIPAVYVFLGQEGMSKGPGLMFIAMPKIFAEMGIAGRILGIAFFIMVFFAALTSSISLLEAVVSGMVDKTKLTRRKSVIIEGAVALAIGIVVCLGYNFLYFEFTMPGGGTGQILDILDFVSNNILMPVLAIGTCIMIGWVVKPKTIIEEATKNGEKFYRKWLYIIMIKFIAPALLILLLISSFGVF